MVVISSPNQISKPIERDHISEINRPFLTDSSYIVFVVTYTSIELILT